ncbi:MAG: extracellular solute-binding protein [Desulfatibacillaceae bacterium]
MKRIALILAAILLAAAPALAQETFPGKDYKKGPHPMASPYAMQGGEMSVFIGPSPKSLNYYLETSSIAANVFGMMYETLLDMNPLTLEWEPGLAARWTISEDKRTFTFHIDPDARWSDGAPVTAHDVQWTYDAITDPKNLTGPHKVGFERLNRPEVVDERTIRFTAKVVHWKNFMTAAGFEILPRHAYGKTDFNKINFEFPVVSGAYRVGEFKETFYLTMERRDDYWNNDAPGMQNVTNFDTIRFRFYGSRENSFDAFMKGKLDVYPVYTSRIWVQETTGEKFENNWVVKQKVYNQHPVGFQGWAMNMRKAPFDDVRVRKAMAHLVDRRKMNATIMYNQYFLHKSYYEDLYDEEHPCPNELFEFDKEKARKLLAEAGWRVNPKTGRLEKDGKPFVFRFLTRDASTDKFLSIFMEDLKDVGISLVIDRKDWAAWIKDMDDFSFDMTWAAWGAGLFKDPEPMWSSAEADRKGGNNYCGFKNQRVDNLIERQKSIFDIETRNNIVREVDQIVYADVPYILLWNIDYVRLLYWNRFGMPPWVLSKYGREESAQALWWYDEEQAADLADAMADGEPLPPRPPAVVFDQVYSPVR